MLSVDKSNRFVLHNAAFASLAVVQIKDDCHQPTQHEWEK